jgi:hypothetical protein
MACAWSVGDRAFKKPMGPHRIARNASTYYVFAKISNDIFSRNDTETDTDIQISRCVDKPMPGINYRLLLSWPASRFRIRIFYVHLGLPEIDGFEVAIAVVYGRFESRLHSRDRPGTLQLDKTFHLQRKGPVWVESGLNRTIGFGQEGRLNE